MSFLRIFYCLNLTALFIIHTFAYHNKSFCCKLLQWHQKLQHLFRGAFYKKLKCKKDAVKLPCLFAGEGGESIEI